MKFLAIRFLLTLTPTAFAQSYQLHDGDLSSLLGASSACVDAYNANVSCPTEVGWLYGNPYQNLDLATLNDLCTSGCQQSLQSHRTSVHSSCNGVPYVDAADNTSYVVTALDDAIIYGYNVACLKRSDGSFCNTWFQKHHSSSGHDLECDECVLGTANLQANSPFNQDRGLQSLYASLTESCGVTTYTTTTPPSAVISSNVPASKTCSGSLYTLQPSDTFKSVPLAQHVSTEQLLSSNGLAHNVSTFPKSGTLCIEQKCKPHVVVANETCSDIAANNNVTTIQIIAWNLNVNAGCSNLKKFVGDVICLSNPLGDFEVTGTPKGPAVSTTMVTTRAPAPTNVASNVTCECGRYYSIQEGDDCSTVMLKFGITMHDFRILNQGINEKCTNIVVDRSYCVEPVGNIATYSGHSGSATAPHTQPPFTPGPSTSVPWECPEPTDNPDAITIPIASGTRVDCWSYLWLNDTSPDDDASDCWAISELFGADHEDFALWNPSIDTNPIDAETPTYNYPCTLSTRVSYCVEVVSPAAPTQTAKAPPSPRAAGEIASCTRWQAIVDDIACDVLVANLALSLDEFHRMNPSVGHDCTGLALGTYYCVSSPDVDRAPDSMPTQTRASSSVQTSASSSVTPTKTTGNSTSRPTPIQSGMADSCVEFHKVVKGDTCYGIAKTANVDTKEFYDWNPAIGTDCHDLEIGVYVCIGISGGRSLTSTARNSAPSLTSTKSTASSETTSTGVRPPGPTQSGITKKCNKFVLQKEGLYCYDMAKAAGITVDHLYSWNPALKDDCSGLYVGYAYCVGVSS